MVRLRVFGLVCLVLLLAAIGHPVVASGADGAIVVAQYDYTVSKPRKPKPPAQQQQQEQEPAAPGLPTQVRPRTSPQPAPQAVSPQPAQSGRPQPAPQAGRAHPAQGAEPTDVAERVLTRRLGSEGLQQALRRIENIAAEAGSGRGAPMADRWFDGASRRTGDDDAVRPGGTPFFGIRPETSAPTPVTGRTRPQTIVPSPVTSGGYQRATVQDAKRTTGQYGSIPGGVVLEGIGGGIGTVKKVHYDRRFNAFILDERAVYFMTIPPKTVALLCLAIAKDDKVGVSLGDTHIVYGAVPPESDLAMDLKIADRFLGDIVFASNRWTAGYRFARGFQPQRDTGGSGRVAVFFNVNGFQFQVQQEEVRLTGVRFDVRLLPLSDSVSAQGGHLPDLDAISRGRVSAQYEANARHVAEEIGYYRRERIVDRTFAYGEVAALIRALKQAGIDLPALARSIPTS